MDEVPSANTVGGVAFRVFTGGLSTPVFIPLQHRGFRKMIPNPHLRMLNFSNYLDKIGNKYLLLY
jgi:hypothetical protein